MNTYTVVLEFENGTYVSQVDAKSESDALLAWCEKIRLERILGSKSSRFARAMEHGVASGLVPVSGVRGTWCFSTLFANRLVLGHMIQTSRE